MERTPQIHFLTTVLLLSGMLTAAAEDKKEIPTFVPEGERSEKAIQGGKIPFWSARPDQAEVLTATFIGGPGHEWLVGGGFQPDGTVVLAGNVAGGVLDLGQRVVVIGRDGTPPTDPVLNKDKKGNEDLPSWKLDGVTGFVVRLSPDLKRVLNAARMPWNSGAITSVMVDTKGNIYLAGKATATFGSLGGNQQKLPVGPDVTRKGGGCNLTFLARLTPDGTQCVWGRSFEGMSDAPTVTIGRDGNLTYGAQDVRRFDPDGKQLSVVTIPGGVRESSSVSPVDGTIAKGGEHMWGTGREPWRCPLLYILNPDGSLRYQLYEWPGPYVGMDNSRLVSDSSIQMVSHDKDGNILAVAWSDGGNSVMTRRATDVRSGVGFSGVGLNAAGAGATSFAYLVKLDPKDYQVIGWTFWGTRYNGKGNGITVRALGEADDGSFCLAGGAAWGLYQTPNFIGRSEPAGSYVAVLTPDMSGVRFCSAIPGTGVTAIGNDRSDTWGIGSGSVNGQSRVLFVAGAKGEGNTYGHMSNTPTVNPLQAKFGGGWSDGYVLVLDLSKGSDQLPKAASSAEAATKRLLVTQLARRVGGKPPVEVPEGTTCYFLPEYPRYVTMDVEVRDAAGKMWPSFLYGRSMEGSLKFAAGGSQGAFVGLADKLCQPRGLQDRRVLGELVKTDSESGLPLKVSFLSFSPSKTDMIQEKDSKGRDIQSSLTWQEAEATLELAGRKLTVHPKCVVSWHPPGRSSTMTSVDVSAFVTVKGRDLGLTKLANEDIDLRITMQGFDEKAPPPKKKR